MLRRSLFATMTLLAGALIVSSCSDKEHPGWEYMPDMYRGPALEAYGSADFLPDSMSALEPVEGTIPRGFMTYENYPNTPEGYEEAKANLEMPQSIEGDSLTLERAAKLYGIFCEACHGSKGDGQGILVEREKMLGVPSYADRELTYGSIFYVITNGKGIMGSHAAQVTPEERWELAHYVMKLRGEITGDSKQEEAETAPEAEAAAQDSTATNQ